METPNTVASALRTLRGTLPFFTRSYPVVFAFGAVASVQRFVSVSYGNHLSAPLMIGGEILTGGVRVLFLVWAHHRLITSDPRLASVTPGERWARLSRFAREHPRVMVGHGLLLSLALVVFKLGSDAVVPALFPGIAGDAYTAWVLAIKNISIIPLTMIWMLTVVRDALVEGDVPAEQRRFRTPGGRG